jgi:hypothetical protein
MYKAGVNKSNHPIQNPLFVTEPRTRDNIKIEYVQNKVKTSSDIAKHGSGMRGKEIF